MRTPEYFSKTEDMLHDGQFANIEQVYGDLVPQKYRFGDWLTIKTDTVDDTICIYFEEDCNAQKALRSGKTYVYSKLLDKEVDARQHIEHINGLRGKAKLPIYRLSIRTVESVELLRNFHKDFFPATKIWCPGMSYDILRTLYGNYCHIQVRPGRLVKNTHGELLSKDPYEFLIKTFEVPAVPVYLELINERVYAWSK